MGAGSWDSSMYATRSTAYKSMRQDEVFTNESVENFVAKNISVRESRDSEDNPKSTPIIFAFDVSGSMGMIPEYIVKEGIGRFMSGILSEQPVSDPHVMVMGIGDLHTDRTPIQATQFEADNRIVDQLRDIYLEGNGGANSFESYDAAWWFAADKTSTDSYEKRGKKGYLFTIGDENFPRIARRNRLELHGVTTQARSSEELLANAQKKYHVFHLNIEEGHYASNNPQGVVGSWSPKLGKRFISVRNYKFLPEIIQAVIEVSEGSDPQDVIDKQQSQEIKKELEYSLGV